VANKIVNIDVDGKTQTAIPELFVDNGDGTFSRKRQGSAAASGGNDKVVNLNIDNNQAGIPIRFVDQGDGTWARKYVTV
jgi:hypothetical protein